VSIPPWERARVAAVRFPARLSVRVTPSAACRGVDGLYGVTQRIKGWIASNAVKTVVGIERGSDARNGASTEGVEGCSDLSRSAIREPSQLVVRSQHIPKNYTAIFGATSSMFPGPGRKSGVHRPTCPAILACLSRGEPCVDDQARSSIEPIWLRGKVDVVNRVEESSCRDLAGLLSGTSGTARRLGPNRVHGHSVRHGGLELFALSARTMARNGVAKFVKSSSRLGPAPAAVGAFLGFEGIRARPIGP